MNSQKRRGVCSSQASIQVWQPFRIQTSKCMTKKWMQIMKIMHLALSHSWISGTENWRHMHTRLASLKKSRTIGKLKKHLEGISVTLCTLRQAQGRHTLQWCYSSISFLKMSRDLSSLGCQAFRRLMVPKNLINKNFPGYQKSTS